MKCPCCNAEMKTEIPLATVWDFSNFMKWLEINEEYPELKKNNYNLKHYFGQVKDKYYATSLSYNEILSRIMKFIKCDVNSNGKFPVKYNTVEKVDIQSHAYILVSNNSEQIVKEFGHSADVRDVISWLKNYMPVTNWGNPLYEGYIEKALLYYKLAE